MTFLKSNIFQLLKKDSDSFLLPESEYIVSFRENVPVMSYCGFKWRIYNTHSQPLHSHKNDDYSSPELLGFSLKDTYIFGIIRYTVEKKVHFSNFHILK